MALGGEMKSYSSSVTKTDNVNHDNKTSINVGSNQLSKPGTPLSAANDIYATFNSLSLPPFQDI